MAPLVIGEFGLDEYILGKVARLNPEAPSPILSKPFEKKIFSGMAANVHANLNAFFEGACKFISHPTPILKVRYCDSSSKYILLRVDDEDNADKTFSECGRDSFLKELPNCSCVVISDYNKGYLSQADIRFIIDEAAAKNKKVFLDTKKILGEWSSKAFCVKINSKEFSENIQHSGNLLFGYYGNYLIKTSGENPVKVWTRKCSEQYSYEYKPKKIEVTNVCGAGDSFLVGLVAGYSKTENLEKSIGLAIDCSSLACSYFGTHQISRSIAKHLLETLV